MDAAPGPIRSPDGLWWWDGKAWQPIATLAVPPAPPLNPVPSPPAPAVSAPAPGAWQPPAAVSEPTPDDGWRSPSATPDPARAAKVPQPAFPPTRSPFVPATVFPAPPSPPAPPAEPKEEAKWPSWLPPTAAAEKVVQDAPPRFAPLATAPPAAAPSAPRAPIAMAHETTVSSWVSQLYPVATGLAENRRLVIGAGLAILGLVAVIITFQVLSHANLFGVGGGTSTSDQGPTGTQFEQADGFLSGSLNPALSTTATAIKTIPVDCGGAHSITCRSTLEDADRATVKAIAVIDSKTFPGCIAASAVQTRHDLVAMDQALRTALIGFYANSDDLTTKGLKDFAALSPTLKADQDGLKATELAACPKTP